jgi:hypothetical protein
MLTQTDSSLAKKGSPRDSYPLPIKNLAHNASNKLLLEVSIFLAQKNQNREPVQTGPMQRLKSRKFEAS